MIVNNDDPNLRRNVNALSIKVTKINGHFWIVLGHGLLQKMFHYHIYRQFCYLKTIIFG